MVSNTKNSKDSQRIGAETSLKVQEKRVKRLRDSMNSTSSEKALITTLSEVGSLTGSLASMTAVSMPRVTTKCATLAHRYV